MKTQKHQILEHTINYLNNMHDFTDLMNCLCFIDDREFIDKYYLSMRPELVNIIEANSMFIKGSKHLEEFIKNNCSWADQELSKFVNKHAFEESEIVEALLSLNPVASIGTYNELEFVKLSKKIGFDYKSFLKKS